jgi:hypothetical protein
VRAVREGDRHASRGVQRRASVLLVHDARRASDVRQASLREGSFVLMNTLPKPRCRATSYATDLPGGLAERCVLKLGHPGLHQCLHGRASSVEGLAVTNPYRDRCDCGVCWSWGGCWSGCPACRMASLAWEEESRREDARQRTVWALFLYVVLWALFLYVVVFAMVRYLLFRH